MRIISVAGTAKNTGKTTTALEIIHQCLAASYRLALTSIGYDGEDRDNITGLPKPRYFLPEGMLLATAKRCLEAGTAGYEMVIETEIQTILGRVILARITKPGLVVIAGPNRAKDLKTVLDQIGSLGANLTIVDGALNRIVPLIVTEGLVLATGAALSKDVKFIAEHLRAMANLFTLDITPEHRATLQEIQVIEKDGNETRLNTGSLLSENTALDIYRNVKGPVRSIIIPGACDPVLVKRLFNHGSDHFYQAQIILGDPLKLVASGDPVAWSQFIDQARKRGQTLTYLATIPILFTTINPFYPRFIPKSDTYEADQVDGVQLLNVVRDAVPNMPVFDILREPKPDLLPFLNLNDATEPMKD